jgi:hypothetical protein
MYSKLKFHHISTWNFVRLLCNHSDVEPMGVLWLLWRAFSHLEFNTVLCCRLGPQLVWVLWLRLMWLCLLVTLDWTPPRHPFSRYCVSNATGSFPKSLVVVMTNDFSQSRLYSGLWSIVCWFLHLMSGLLILETGISCMHLPIYCHFSVFFAGSQHPYED